MHSLYPHLFSPLKVGPLTLKHRIMSSPTSLAELSPEERYSPANIAYYRLKAEGGASLVTVGDAIVHLGSGKSHPLQVGLDDPALVPSLAELADTIKSGGAVASIEIDHGGELCPPEFLTDGLPMGPSGGIDEYGDEIREMTPEDMDRIADVYAAAAVTAKKCGFDMVMLHAGHGWLIHQFISPLSNRRTDEFGGSFENRMRFPLMVIDRIRRAVGLSFPIDIRISAHEMTEGGYDLDTGVAIAKAVDGKVDLIHVSAGTQKVPYSAVLMHPPIFSPDGPFVEYSRAIKKAVKTPVVVVGALADADMMEEIVSSGAADAVALGRALLADPQLPQKLLRGSAGEVTPCLRCLECEGSLAETRTLRCTVNPIIGRELDALYARPGAARKRVLIAGGGPAGCSAAITAAGRGHEVILLERDDALGGALRFADGVDFKSKVKKLYGQLAARVHSLPIDLRLGTAATPELIREIAPDTLIIAVGASPLKLPIPGLEDSGVKFGADLEAMRNIDGERIVICGGGLIGCETSLHLAQEGREVTIIEMLPEVARDANFMHRIALLHELDSAGVALAAGHRCTRFEPGRVFASDADGAEHAFEGDEVIVAMGLTPRSAEAYELMNIAPETLLIGDCFKSARIMQAIRAGYDAALNLR